MCLCVSFITVWIYHSHDRWEKEWGKAHVTSTLSCRSRPCSGAGGDGHGGGSAGGGRPCLVVRLSPSRDQLSAHLPREADLVLARHVAAGERPTHQQELSRHLQPCLAVVWGVSPQQGSRQKGGVPGQHQAVDVTHRAAETPYLPAHAVAPAGPVQHWVQRAEHQAQGTARTRHHQTRALQTGEAGDKVW